MRSLAAGAAKRDGTRRVVRERAGRFARRRLQPDRETGSVTFVWTIRRDQLRAFEVVARGEFERRAVRHLRTALPQRFGKTTEEAMLELVRRAIEKGEQYAIRAERDVLVLLNVMVLLGSDFDTAPTFAWARELLDKRRVEASSRLQVVWERAKRQVLP